MLVDFVEWPDDKNRPFGIKLTEYSSRRLYHELQVLVPGTGMGRELLMVVKDPAASLRLISDVNNLVGSILDPRDYFKEVESGPYKGMTVLEKNLYKAPIPIMREYRQVDKIAHNIDTSINYYARSSSY